MNDNNAEAKPFLHYGCLVYLTYKDEQGLEYYVTADGYTKHKIQLKKKEDILEQSSIQASLFKIYPTFYNNEYVKARKKYEDKRKCKKFTVIDRRESRAEIPKQIKAMEDETLQNYEQYDKFKNSNVLFGQTIQFLHINSNKYLFYDVSHVSEYESNNLKVGLKDEHSDETCFRIQPCYTFQQEGSGNIYDEDIVNIVSTVDQMKKVGGEPYVHSSKAKQFDGKSGSDGKVGKQKDKREVNISTEKKTPWRIHIFSEYIDEREGFLAVQDSVWINFSEQDLNLVIYKEKPNEQQRVIKFENYNASAQNKFTGSSNGMFTIESEEIFKGGLIKWSSQSNPNKYRLRHLTTMQYLTVKQAIDTDYQVDFVPNYQNASLFQFELIYSTLTSYKRDKARLYLQKDSYFRLSTVIIKKQESLIVVEDINIDEQLTSTLWFRTYMLPLQPDCEEEYGPLFSEVKKDEFVFKLAKVNFNEVRMTNFLLSCLKTIKGSEQYLKPNFLSSQTMNDEKFQGKYKNFLMYISRLEKCLIDLQLFCHNRLIAYLYIDQEYGSVNTFIQNVLREQQFIEMLIKMLCISFPTYDDLLQLKELEIEESKVIEHKMKQMLGEEQKKSTIQLQIKREFFQRKKKVCSLIYKLLGAVCEQNQINQALASNYLPIFAQQSPFISQALECIMWIHNNHEELLLRITSSVNDEDLRKNIVKSNVQKNTIKTAIVKKNIVTPKVIVEKPGQKQFGDVVNQTLYSKQYNKIAASIVGEDFEVIIKWDLILFFTNLLKDKGSSASKKRDLISFLQFTSTFQGRGLNSNQERVYRTLLANGFDNLFDNEVLIKIQAEGNNIKVYFMGEERAFIEFFSKEKKGAGNAAAESEVGQSKALSVYLKRQGIATPSSQVPTALVLSLISMQIDFYSSMVNSRNNTWKSSLESFLPGEVLIFNLVDNVIGYDMRAIICRLLNKMYVDQEPRRVIVLPGLCKILSRDSQAVKSLEDSDTLLNQSNLSGGADQYTQDINLDSLKSTLLLFISVRKEQAEKLSNMIELKDSDTAKIDKLQTISSSSEDIYNKLTLEVVRLLKLLIEFGKYQLKLGADENETKLINADLFGLLSSLFVVLEFDSTYPEARKILMEQRKEDKEARSKGPNQLLGNVFGMFGDILGMLDIFGLMDGGANTKKKKIRSQNDEGETMNMNESFLKQSNVLKKILNKFLQEGNDIDLLIKLEICDILDKYLDQKMDFCLENFTTKFKEYVKKLKLIEKLESGEMNIVKDKKQIQEEFKKVFANCIQAIIPPIMHTGTSVDKTDPKLKKEESLIGFGGLSMLGNIAGVGDVITKEGPSEKIESIDINKILDFEIFPSLITLFCMTQSLSMETKLLNILTRFYNQRLEFAELSSKIIVLFDPITIRIFKALKSRIRNLAKNIDESEIWLSNLQIADNMMTLKQTQAQFDFFNDLLKTDSSIDANERVCFNQSVDIDVVRQDMMRNVKVYDLVIAIIKDNIHLVDVMSKDQQQQELLRDLFSSALRFLKNFVFKNPTNQWELSQHLGSLIVSIQTDLGQVALINEIFRDNKRVCLEKSTELIDDFIDLIVKNGRQAKYLDFFLIIQKVKNEYISSNQKAVLNIFIDPRNKQHIFAIKNRHVHHHHHLQHENKVQTLAVRSEFDFQMHEFLDKPQYYDQPYIYHTMLLQVLYNTTIGIDGMLQNEQRLRSIISLKYSLELLCHNDEYLGQMPRQHLADDRQELKPKEVTQMKVPILNYLYYTYLESEKMSDDIFKCINEVNEYILFEFNRLEYITPQMNDTQYLDYLFTYFMLLINALTKIYQRELRENNMVMQNQQVVMSQIETLLQSRNLLKKEIVNSEWIGSVELNQSQTRLFQFFTCDDILDEEKRIQQKKEDDERKRQEELARQQLLKEEGTKIQKQKTKFPSVNLTINVFAKKTVFQPPIDFNSDVAYKQLWDLYLNSFLESKELKSEIEDEHLIFAKALDKVETIFMKDNMMAEHINKNTIFNKLINFLLKGNSQQGTTNTIKQVLQALCNYIVISKDNLDPLEEEEDKPRILAEEKASHQNFLNSNNAMAIVLQLLSDCRDKQKSEAIYNDLISFAIMLMDGGNRDVQKSVYTFFQNFTSSEVLFLRIHEKFDFECLEIRKEDESDDFIVVYGFQKQANEILNTMRFMQLLAEGHYSELQNYMRFQNINYHSYDLFTDVVELLNGYLLVSNYRFFDNMMQCFDTITEFVQGPCFDNQIALFQANFLDTASNLLTFDEIIDEIDRLINSKNEETQDLVLSDSQMKTVKIKVPFPRWMYARLKYKCSITLLSLLEARKTDDNVIRLLKSLSLDVLKRNQIDIFNMFQDHYNKEYAQAAFEHFSQDPDPNDPQSLDKASFIIQTGFNLYVLYSIFTEFKESNDGEVKSAEQTEEDGLKAFLENSILGKIMGLFMSILKGIKDTLIEMKDKAQGALLGKQEGEKSLNFKKQQIQLRRTKSLKKAMSFYSSHSAHIEVVRDDKMLEKTYFYLPPYCSSLDKETKTKFNSGANRISVKAKVTSLLQESEDLIKKMKLNYKLNLWLNKVQILAVLVANIQLLRDIAFIMALIINIMVLIEYKKETDDEDSTPIKSAIILMGIIVIVLSMLIVAYFLAKTAPLIIKKAWVGVQKDKLNPIKYFKRLLMTIILLISDFYVLYYCIYGFTAIIGTTSTPFFFAFHLFDVLVRFPVLLNVVKAVWEPRKAIMFTLFLFIVMMYVFSLFAYYWLSESYTRSYCDSTWKCLLTAIDRSFKYDGGLGGFLTPSNEVKPNDVTYFMVRFAFDNIYFILLMIIMINIVSGIIIDTFGTLREELNEYNFDLENYCFICGFDKEVIEKSSKNQLGFTYHIKQEHYLWNYLFYISYIKNKDPTELSGIESYVADKIDSEDISWFPTFKALCMNDISEDQEQAEVTLQLEKVLDEQNRIKIMLESINEQIEQLEDEFNKP